MSIHTNYRVSCEAYPLIRMLGLSLDEAAERLPVGRCMILSDHRGARRPHRLPTTEQDARDEAAHAGWVRRRLGGSHTYDVCPKCVAIVDELMQDKVAEPVLQS